MYSETPLGFGAGQIPHLPNLYCDELLYSYVARIARYNGWSSPALLKHLYGKDSSIKARMSADLPIRIGAICSKFPSVPDYDPRLILHRHTLIPYHTSFLPSLAKDDIIKNLIDSDAKNGLNTIGKNIRDSYLKFCPQCNLENLNKFGESYWNRLHQLPLVDICLKHKTVLKLTEVKAFRNSYLICVDNDSCPYDARPCVSFEPGDNVNQFIEFAKYSHSLLRRPKQIEDFAELKRLRMNKLSHLNLLTSGSMIRADEFADAAQIYVGSITKYHPIFDINGRWISNLLGSEHRCNSPVYHILFDYILKGLLNDGIKITSRACWPAYKRLFSGYKWPCRNRLTCDEVRENVRIVNTSRRKGGIIVATMQCECGYSYSVSRRPDGKFNSPRYKSAGPEVEHYLCETKGRNVMRNSEKLSMSLCAYRSVLKKCKKNKPDF